MKKNNADDESKKDKKISKKTMEKEPEAIHIIALIHSYRQIIDSEKKSIKKLKKYVSSDEMEQFKKHLKDAEKALDELTDGVFGAVFKNMKCFKNMKYSKSKSVYEMLSSPLTIKICDSTVYGFPTKLSKHLNKDDWSPFYEHLNKAALQVVKNQIKGHEKNGDKKYLPFKIMIVAEYQVYGNLDQIQYPLVTIPFSKDGVNVQKEILRTHG